MAEKKTAQDISSTRKTDESKKTTRKKRQPRQGAKTSESKHVMSTNFVSKRLPFNLEKSNLVNRQTLLSESQDANENIKRLIVVGEPPTSDEIDITTSFRQSSLTLDNYVTLDWKHRQEINGLIETIRNYAQDSTRNRPLNIMMQAEPGSGKSHFIKCLAKKMSEYNISEVTFNMASLHNIEDFIQPLEAVRNRKVADKIPLLFLDEFDSEENNYALLLPLLWDGELSVGHRDLKVGKIIIILAGSGPQIEQTMRSAKGMQKEIPENKGKLNDLLSRINGGELRIPKLDEVDGVRDRRVDKVCLSIALLQKRFGKKLELAPWGFLRFISDSKFRYDARSIAHLIDLIPATAFSKDKLMMKNLKLPLQTVEELKTSSLAYHVIAEDGPASVVEIWKQLRLNESLVRFEYDSSTFTSLLRDLFKKDSTTALSLAAGS